MNTHIDWLSFSFPVGQSSYPEQGWQWPNVYEYLRAYTGNKLECLFDDEEVEHHGGRAPYAHGTSLHSGLLVVYWGGRLDHGLVQIHGQGMDYVREKGIEKDLLLVASERVTRVDLATDIETDVKPSEFVERRTSKKQTTVASVTSPQGETEYVGSRISERFARVYRYRNPHPRANLLRVEHELKGKTAKATLPIILEVGIDAAQSKIGLSFGWFHPIWQPSNKNLTKIKSPRNDRTMAGTEIWLRTQCASAFRTLVLKGLIDDPEQWLREVFLDQLPPS